MRTSETSLTSNALSRALSRSLHMRQFHLGKKDERGPSQLHRRVAPLLAFQQLQRLRCKEVERVAVGVLLADV
jgi:hypothetical protein